MTLSKPDFDFAKYVEVPDQWIENALNIPNTAQQKPKVTPFPRRIAVAASIVLVTVLGISVYFLFRNKSPISVKPSNSVIASQTQSESETAGANAIESTQYVSESIPSTQLATDSLGNVIRISPTIPQSTVIINGTESVTHSRSDSTDAQAGTEPPQLDPPFETTPDVPYRDETHPTETRPDVPRPGSTEKPVESASSPTPTQAKPDPTDPPVLTPTFPEPCEPASTEEPTDKPEPPTEPDPVLTFRTEISAQTKIFHGVVYCRIYDRDRKIVLGDPDRYAASHLAEWTQKGNKIYIVYRPSEHGIEIPPGNYAISFHNEEGKLLISYYRTVS